MQKKEKSNRGKLLFGMMTFVMMTVMAACSNPAGNGGWGPDSLIPPEKPRIISSQTSFEFDDSVDLKSVTPAIMNEPDKWKAVVSLAWEGEGALSYNVYWNNENARPGTPNVSGIKDASCFARNLEAETEYFFWIEAVNPKGTTLSDPIRETTGKKGSYYQGGVARSEYPLSGQFKVVPGNGSLTVTWGLFERAGWYEVYYAPVGTIKHLDIYTPLEFRYDSNVPLEPGTIDISGDPAAEQVDYKSKEKQGYTRKLYPFLTPLAGNNGWEGYYVLEGSSRVSGDGNPVLGVNELEKDAFYKIMECHDTELSEPYQPLDAAFSQAIPWDGEKAGSLGTPIKFFGTSTTITGLVNGQAYEVWLRCPNANGERGYSYVVGTPGAETSIPPPSNVRISTAGNNIKSFDVSWEPVPGAQNYRIYTSKYEYTPNKGALYTLVSGEETAYTISGLQSSTTYYVWVVSEKNGMAGSFGPPISGKTGEAPSTGKNGDKIIAGTDHKVKIAVYVEVNDDNPLNAGSYVLEDGTYLFDYVILFAANIRSRNCTTDNGDGCTENGPHVHFNPNVRYLLENRSKYIKPLQDKGIKVLLGLLGDHDGISFSSMDDASRAAFIADLKKDVEHYGLDGVDFDDEWASKEDWDNWTDNYRTISPNSIWTYPVSTWGWPTSTIVYRNPDMGIAAGNGQHTAPSAEAMDRMWYESGENYYKTIRDTREALGPSKIISLYEYNTGRYITPGGQQNGTVTVNMLNNSINFALQPWYNQYIGNSANGLSNSIYSPFGMDVSGDAYASQNGFPNPPISVYGNTKASGTLYDYAARFRKSAEDGAPYNMLYCYGLEAASELLKESTPVSTFDVPKEDYLSIMTGVLFDQQCLLTQEGERGDYRKDW